MGTSYGVTLSALLALAGLGLAFAPRQAPAAGATVAVSFTARDAQGNPVRDLKPSEITLSEDNKPQSVTGLQWLDVDAAPVATNSTPVQRFDGGHFDGRRLVVFYFDLTEMAPAQVVAAQESAAEYINRLMRPADLAGVAALGTSLEILQDFTSDKSLLLQAVGSLNPTTSVGMNTGADDGGLTAADRSFVSVHSLCDGLALVEPRKAVLMYTSGIPQSGSNNAMTLRTAVNAAVKGNISIYSLDARLLPARAGGGGAARAGAVNSSTLTGGSARGQVLNALNEEDALATFANDTAGRALLDSSDDDGFYTRMQDDTRLTYLATYVSGNPKRDGKYRKIEIRTSRPGVQIRAMPGYTAPKGH